MHRLARHRGTSCCAPIWRWFTEAAWAAGLIPTPEVPVEWSPPKFEAVDPQKEAAAQLLAIRSGTMTLAEVIARQGRNPDAVLHAADGVVQVKTDADAAPEVEIELITRLTLTAASFVP